ncbi:MAG: O-antigen ligase family protein [Planctomycetota bacterium]
MSRHTTVLRHAGFGGILTMALARVMTAHARVPYWDADPLAPSLTERVVGPFEPTLTPAMSLTFDAIVWMCAAAAILGEVLAGRRLLWRSGVCVGIGVLGVALHGFVLTPFTSEPGILAGDFRSLATASTWAAAMVGAWALLHLGRDPVIRQTGMSTLLGVIVVLVAKGAFQVFVEHERTVALFRDDPAAVFARHRINPDSVAAREFVRRLMQPEATGWFGLANVYATFAAVCFVGWGALSVGAWKRCREGALQSGPAAAITLGALCGAGALWFSGSKGGAVAAIIGVGVVASVWGSAKLAGLWERRGGLLALGLIGVSLCGIAARGLIGERLSELSLLFRWQYIVASIRMWLDRPLSGVGPAEYKAAYALHKLPLNPEMVESPHSVLFDWTSTLGLFGLGFGAAFLGWVWLTGRGMAHESEQERGPSGIATRVGVLAALLAALIAWRLDWRLILADELLVRLLALGGWIGLIVIGSIVVAVGGVRPRLAIAAAALVAAVHAQIEVTPVMGGSAMWLLGLLGLAAAPSVGMAGEATGRFRVVLAPALLIVVAGGLVAGAVLPAWAWQGRLKAAAEALRTLDGSFTAEQLATGRELLLEADALQPSAPDARERAIRLTLFEASQHRLAGRDVEAADSARLAMDLALEGAAQRPASGARWAVVANTAEAAATIVGDRSLLRQSYDAWERVAGLDPYGLSPAIKLWQLSRVLGLEGESATWALRALEADEQLRLDPLKRLSEQERLALLRDAGG